MIRERLKRLKGKAEPKKETPFREKMLDGVMTACVVSLLILGLIFCMSFSEVHIAGSISGTGNVELPGGEISSLEIDFEADVPLLAVWWLSQSIEIGGLGG